MIEISVARLRSRLASILEIVRDGESVVIRRHGTRVALLSRMEAGPRREVSRRHLGGPSKLPSRLDTGSVDPIRIHGRLKRSPSQELAEERE
jgi:prevent-host-death family protein